MANEKVDVVIVGAGASGSVYASVLAKAGRKVVLFDNGPDWKSEDLISSDIWGRRIKPAGAPFLHEGRHPFGYTSQAGWGVGGAALHYFANFPRLLPTDFRIKSEHGRAHDWPISYDDVAPYFDKVAAEIGVSGDAKAESKWRPAGAPYPMPPMKTFKGGEIWKKACAENGIQLVPTAVGMNSVPFKGRDACIYDGWCHVGCPIGALANPVVTYLSDARKAGAEVRALSTVTRVLTNAEGTKATGIEYYDARNEKQVQEASVVILAAWAAQNPRLLLNSATAKHPNGLANKGGMVGKFMMQPMAIDPAHGVDVNAHRVVDEGHRLHEPGFVVQGAVRDPQMDHVGKIQSAQEPGEQQVTESDHNPPPGSEPRWCQNCRQQNLKEKRREADQIVGFHCIHFCIGSEIRRAFPRCQRVRGLQRRRLRLKYPATVLG